MIGPPQFAPLRAMVYFQRDVSPGKDVGETNTDNECSENMSIQYPAGALCDVCSSCDGPISARLNKM